MKKFFLVSIISILTITSALAQNQQELWNKANSAFGSGDYQSAVSGYNAILAQGEESAKLYFNLGCAYYKLGQVGKSLVNLYRAENLDPADDDIEYNIAYVNANIQDKIEVVPDFFVKRWVVAVRSLLSSNRWAIVSVVSLVVALGFAILYLLSGRMYRRKIGFYLGITFSVLFLLTTLFAASSKLATTSGDKAVVIVNSAAVKASPDGGGKDVFVLHEGAKVSILRSVNNFYEIKIVDGNNGWIETNVVEVI